MQLTDVIAYDESSPSCLRWIAPRSNRLKPGDVAGTFNKATGYWQVNVLGKLTYAHRVVAKLFGLLDDESLQVDHINRDRSDNKLTNIRVVSQLANLLNKGVRGDSTSGVTGVNWNKAKGMWQVRITVNKKTKSLGYFHDMTEAIKARRSAEEVYGYAAYN